MKVYEPWLELYESLCDEPDTGTPTIELEHVARVYCGEPRAGDLVGPISGTGGFEGTDAYDVRYSVRIYVKPGSDALTMQARGLQTIEHVETVLGLSSTFVRADWSAMQYNGELDAFVITAIMSTGREDF